MVKLMRVHLVKRQLNIEAFLILRWEVRSCLVIQISVHQINRSESTRIRDLSIHSTPFTAAVKTKAHYRFFEEQSRGTAFYL